MRRRFAPLMVAALLGGCVTPPTLRPAPVPRAIADTETQASFAAPATAWPADGWWTAYGDPQLDGLIDEALRTAPTMALAEARLRKAQSFVQAANAATLPSVSLDAALSVSKPSTETGLPVPPERHGYQDYGRVTLGLAWDLDFWGRNRAALAAATSDAEAAAAEAAAARLLVSASVAIAYADLARLHADRDTLVDMLAVRGKSLKLVQARVTHGFDSDADLAQAEGGPAAARAELAAADEAIGLARNRLAALLGAGPDRGLKIERPAGPALKAFGLPPNLAADLLGRRPDVVAARRRVEAAEGRIKVARAQFYPNVNLLALVGFEALGIGNLLDQGAGIGAAGPAISLPIFDGGRRRANYRGARADHDGAVALYDETLTQALRDVADVSVSSRQHAIELDHAAQALAASERAYRLAVARYKAGGSDYQSVLIVEDGLLARRRRVAALRSRAFILDVALVRSLGGGVTVVSPPTR